MRLGIRTDSVRLHLQQRGLREEPFFIVATN